MDITSYKNKRFCVYCSLQFDFEDKVGVKTYNVCGCTMDFVVHTVCQICDGRFLKLKLGNTIYIVTGILIVDNLEE